MSTFEMLRSAPRALLEERRAEVWRRLDDVSDPELDEPVTDLKFVTGVEIDAAWRVAIGFRLPTYWCAANFSFLMADDMRVAVSALPWVAGVDVRLGEHMYADTINAGLAQGLSFSETFGAEADGDLDALRQTFLVKAFQRRQAALLGHLAERGVDPERLVALPLDALPTLCGDAEGDALVRRYLERRHVVGSTAAPASGPLAFVDGDGEALAAATFPTYLRNLRRVGVNAEFNSALCKGLLAVRFDTETPFVRSQSAR